MTDRVAVVGGGIAGLVAADTLTSADPDVDVTVLEAAPRLGGKVRTSELAGLAVDEGADAFLARVPWGRELAEDLGLGPELVSPARGNAKLWIDGARRDIPTPMVLGVPLDPATLAASGTVSDAAVAALRADLDRLDGPTLGVDDVSVGAVIRERLGGEILRRLVDPLLGGINAGNCDNLSLDASAPLIAEAARRGPSLARALTEQRRAGPSADPDAPVFFGLPGGMQRLVDRLARRLGDRVRCSTPITDIDLHRGVHLHTAGGVERYDAAILTVPAHVAAPLLASSAPAPARQLGAVEFASVVLVSLAYDPDDVTIPLDASGMLVPADQGPDLTAVSWASSKWAHLGGGPVVLRASLGRHRADEAIEASDDHILETVRRDLRTTMDINAAPAEVRISRWPRGFPQYTVGHARRVDEIDTALAPASVFVAGASYRGLGVPACIDQGRKAAARLLAAR